MAPISKRLGHLAGKAVAPGQVQAMMGEMMTTMFADMTVEDRLSFVATMLSQCLGAIFANLGAPARQQLTAVTAEKMISVSAAHGAAPQPGRALPTRGTSSSTPLPRPFAHWARAGLVGQQESNRVPIATLADPARTTLVLLTSTGSALPRQDGPGHRRAGED